MNSKSIKRFLVPVAECEFALNSILDDLQADPWPIEPGHRPQRCIGTAISIATSLLEAAGGAVRGSRIVNLIGGAATYGPGMIVSNILTETIRSHQDITKEQNLMHMKKATKFYQDIATRAMTAGIVMDFFSKFDSINL
jgi:protein transport protein SEC23